MQKQTTIKRILRLKNLFKVRNVILLSVTYHPFLHWGLNVGLQLKVSVPMQCGDSLCNPDRL